jgi:hypothetical protein
MRRRLRKADFGERRLFQSAAVALTAEVGRQPLLGQERHGFAVSFRALNIV